MSALFLKKYIKFLAMFLIGSGLGVYVADWDSFTADKVGWLLFGVGGIAVAVLAYVERELPSPERFFSGRLLRVLSTIVFGGATGYALGLHLTNTSREVLGPRVDLLAYFVLVGIGLILWTISTALVPVSKPKRSVRERRKRRRGTTSQTLLGRDATKTK